MRKILAEDDLADDDRRQTNDDSTTAHVDVGEALILGQQTAGQRDQAVGDHQAQHLGNVGVDALGTGHVLVSAGGTQRAAQLSAKEPVQHSDQHRAEDDQDQDGVIEGHIADITGRDQQAVLIHADGQVGFAAARAETHNAEIDRIQRQLGQNTGQNSRDAAGRVEQARNKARQHTCCRSRQQGQPHRRPVKHHNNADRTAGTERAVDRQIGHIQDAVG